MYSAIRVLRMGQTQGVYTGTIHPDVIYVPTEICPDRESREEKLCSECGHRVQLYSTAAAFSWTEKSREEKRREEKRREESVA